MNNDIITLLDEELVSQLTNLSTLSQGSQEHTAAIESINKLYKLKLEEIKNQQDHDEKLQSRKDEKLLTKIQWKRTIIEMCIKHGVEVGLALITLAAYGTYFSRGLKFEETGTFTSHTMRNLMGNFRPKKK